MKKILIAEDDYIIATLIKDIIQNYGHTVVGVAHSGEEAINQAFALQPDMVFLDINMDYKTAGIDACKAIKEKLPHTKVFFLTAYTKDSFENELNNVPYDGYFDKVDFDKVIDKLFNHPPSKS